ncbi:Cell number regulator 10 [Spatholobus suberectus]|nr:Cell number regulator 10 [Spatholobus suberectus]
MAALGGSWSTGLCNCCADEYGAFCLTCWCPCISFGRIAEIIDRGATCGFTQFASLYACIYRTKLRRMYGIEGSQCCDCVVSCCCVSLSICQEYRELEARGFDVSAGWDRNVELHTPGAMEAPSVECDMNRYSQ